MLFSSVYFLFCFLPVLLVIYFAIPKRYNTARNAVLLVFSLFFYSWGEPVYVFLMIFSIAFNYAMALDISKEREVGKRGTLVFTVIINLLILSFFKYYGFFLDTVSDITGLDITYTALPLPIGISFYTFQAMSYIIDVYRGDTKVQRSVFRFGLYLSLFPQLIAGPIVKYRDVADQLESRETGVEQVGEGSVRFIMGLAKKVILANGLGALHASVLAMAPHEKTVLAYWLGAVAYTLQIYFDFSGYSDMAIGLGRIFGFRFMENFDHPYISRSVTEFWRRWHISLSTWFREYLYIPLGGNRVPAARHILNLLIVWSLTGLWHGASWNFVVWGLYYGIILIIEKYLTGRLMEKLPSIARHLITLFIVMIGWVFFFSEDLSSALEYLRTMFFAGGAGFADRSFLYLLRTNFVLLALSCWFSGEKPKKMFDELSRGSSLFAVIIPLILFLISSAYLIFSSYNPFLYFRF